MPIQCPRCEYITPDDLSEAVDIAVFNAHVTAHMPTTTAAPVTTPAPARRGPKLERPKVDTGVSLEEWNVFARRWDAFVLGSGLEADDCASQLFQCAGGELGDDILKMDPAVLTRPTQDLFSVMKNLAVIAVAPGVLRAELMQMHQDRDETFRTFAAKVRGKAETCGYTNHDCREACDFTQSMVKDVLVAGTFDLDIRREVLSTDGILLKTINEIISLVESKETARNALPSTSAALSQFKRNQRTSKFQDKKPTSGNTQTVPCPDCGKTYALFTEGSTGWNSKPHPQCIDCFRKSRKQRNRQHGNIPQNQQGAGAADNAQIGGMFAQIATISAPPTGQQPQSEQAVEHVEVVAVAEKSRNRKSICLPHQIFSKGEWRRARFRNHPRLNLSISVNRQDYKDFGVRCPRVTGSSTDVLTDSGAQLNQDFFQHRFQDFFQPVVIRRLQGIRLPRR